MGLFRRLLPAVAANTNVFCSFSKRPTVSVTRSLTCIRGLNLPIAAEGLFPKQANEAIFIRPPAGRFLATQTERQESDDLETTAAADDDDIKPAEQQVPQSQYTVTDEKYQKLAHARLLKHGVYDPTEVIDLMIEGAMSDNPNDESFMGNGEYEVHKRILVDASPYFAKTLAEVDAFHYDCNGDGNREITCMWEFDHGTLGRIFEFIYYGSCRLSEDEKHGDPLRQLHYTLDAAKLLEIPEFEAACARALLSPTFFNTDDEQACTDIIDTWMYAKARGNEVLLEKLIRKFAKIFPDNGQLGEGFLQLGEADANGVLYALSHRRVSKDKLGRAALSWLNANWELFDETDTNNWCLRRILHHITESSSSDKLSVEQRKMKWPGSKKIKTTKANAMHNWDLWREKATKQHLRKELQSAQFYPLSHKERHKNSTHFSYDDYEVEYDVKQEESESENSTNCSASDDDDDDDDKKKVVLSRQEIHDMDAQVPKLKNERTQLQKLNENLRRRVEIAKARSKVLGPESRPEVYAELKESEEKRKRKQEEGTPKSRSDDLI